MAETIFLRFADRASALDALRPLGLTITDDTGVETFPPMAWLGCCRVDVDVLGGGTGLVWSPTGAVSVDPETGIEVPEMAPRPGFHLNVRWDAGTVPEFGDARLFPQSPNQIFAA